MLRIVALIARADAKTPRNRVNFSDHRQMLGESLCLSRLNGGAGDTQTCSTRLPVLISSSARPFGDNALGTHSPIDSLNDC